MGASLHLHIVHCNRVKIIMEDTIMLIEKVTYVLDDGFFTGWASIWSEYMHIGELEIHISLAA